MAGEQDEVEVNDAAGQTDLRTTLENAVEQAEKGQPEEAPEAPPESGSKPPAPEPEPDPEQVGRPRDENGRFTKAERDAARTRETAAQQSGSAAARPGDLGAPPPAPKLDRAPQDWGPKAREHWAKLPQEVREEAYRLHVGARQAHAAADQAARQAEQFRAPIQQFEQLSQRYPHALRSGAGNVFAGLENVMRLAHVVEAPDIPPQVKARVVADIIEGLGIPEQLVAGAIDARRRGQPGPQFMPQQQMGPMRDPRVDQLFGALERERQQSQLAEQQEAATTVSDFGSDKEFFQDVRHVMADIVDARHRAKQPFTLDEVYDIACQANPQIREVLRQREQQSRSNPAVVARARRAAGATIRSSGVAPDAGSGDNSIRSLLEAGFSSGRR